MSPDTVGRPPRSDYITLDEAAKLTGWSTRTIQRMMTDGKLGFRRTPGGQRKLYRSSLEKYIALTLDTGDSRV